MPATQHHYGRFANEILETDNTRLSHTSFLCLDIRSLERFQIWHFCFIILFI